jgi:hypothetical protein
MNFTLCDRNFYLEDGKQPKKDPHYYTNTKIYKYHTLHPELSALEEIITDSLIRSNFSKNSFLRNCYTRIIDCGLELIIYDIMSEPHDNDELAICKVAIDKNKLNLLDFLLTKKFDLNQIISDDNIHHFLDYDILSYAVIINNLSIVKYLVENGADPLKNEGCALKKAYVSKTEDIFDYFINLDMSYQSLCGAFDCCCNHIGRRENHDSDKLKKLINKGININDISEVISSHIVNFPIDMVKFLVDRGFNIDSARILARACAISNDEFVDFYLEQGLQINMDCLKIIFNTMNMDMINILIKHNINLSVLEQIKDHCDTTNKLEALGLDKDVLIGYLMNKINRNEYSFTLSPMNK